MCVVGDQWGFKSWRISLGGGDFLIDHGTLIENLAWGDRAPVLFDETKPISCDFGKTFLRQEGNISPRIRFLFLCVDVEFNVGSDFVSGFFSVCVCPGGACSRYTKWNKISINLSRTA